MAIRATSSEHLLCGSVGRHTGTLIEGGRMESLAMALLAEPWLTHTQHAWLVGAVRIVAIGAILTHRLVFPQERSAFFLMALVTGLVDGILGELIGTGRAVRIMAVGAGHLAFPDRVVRSFVDLCAFVLMTGKADF